MATYPLGIKELACANPAAWSAGFDWPVSYDEYNAIVAAWVRSMDAAMAQSQQWQNIINLVYCEVSHLSSILYYDLVIARLLRRDPGLKGNLIHPHQYCRGQDAARPFQNLAWIRRKQNGLYAFLENRRIGLKSFLYPKVDPLGKITEMTRMYAAKNNVGIAMSCANDWIENAPVSATVDDCSLAASIATWIIGRMAQELALIAGVAEDLSLEDLVPQLQQAVERAIVVHHRVSRRLQKPRHFVAVNFGNLLHRAILQQNLVLGGRNAGFTHGAALGLVSTPIINRVEWSMCHSLHVISRAVADTMNRQAQTPLAGKQVAMYEKLPVSGLRTLHKQCASIPSRPVRRVMMLGFPFNNNTLSSVRTGFTPVMLDLEFRLINSLNRYAKLLYKPHPDRMSETNNGQIWGAYVDTVETAYFQDCYQKADLLFFPYIHSTALLYALMTRHPIAYLDIESANMPPEAKELFDRRAIPVRAWTDDRNRIVYDEAELQEAVQNPPSEVNDDYIRKYCFDEVI